jgi:hypothetical protein
MVPIAILNGALRQGWYGQHLAELTAHQVSTATALLLLGVYMRTVIRRWPPRGVGEALAIGFLWLGLTLAFEFLFGHFVAGHTWTRLLADYDLAAGRAWVLIPLWVGLAPWVFRPRHSAP